MDANGVVSRPAGRTVDALAEARSSRRPTHRVTVTAVEQLTPHMRRLTFEGASLAAVSAPLPAQWLKVIPPGSEEARRNRAYTIRRLYPGSGALNVDFVLHGDAGSVSAWARRAKVGDVVHLGSPRGGFRIDLHARWRLFAGDETALPAIASILETLRCDEVPTRALIEVPTEYDAQVLRASPAANIRWLPRNGAHDAPGTALATCVCGLSLPRGFGQIFLAGEAGAVRSMREDLARRAPEVGMDAKGYWRVGCADHRDEV